ncbi:hypothetical protein [Methylobrevis pamukkalensis]
MRVRDGQIAEIGLAADLHARHPDLPVEGGDSLVAVPGLVTRTIISA